MKMLWEVQRCCQQPVILEYMIQKLKTGLTDKYKIEACCHFLWKFNMTINPVSNGTDIVHASYRHHMGKSVLEEISEM